MKKSLSSMAALACCQFALAPFALGQGAPAKVGVINIQQAILSTREGQKAAQDLQARFDPRGKEIEKKNADIVAKQEQFRKGGNVISEEQKNKLAREIDALTKSLNRDREDAQAEFEQEQGKVLNALGGRLIQVIDKYGRDNAYTLILDVSSQQTPVLYIATGTDITAEIVKIYDANAPAPAAPATAKPTSILPSPVKPTAAPAPVKKP